MTGRILSWYVTIMSQMHGWYGEGEGVLLWYDGSVTRVVLNIEYSEGPPVLNTPTVPDVVTGLGKKSVAQ